MTAGKLILKKNDRIVFLGDSITEQQLYTNYVEAYLASRYPQLNLSFFNAGWGGDTAPGGVRRLDRDVLSLRPTVVTLCYGMNDGRYGPSIPEVIDPYVAGMKELVRRLRAAKVRVVLMTPGIVDPERNAALKPVNYNETTLRQLADSVLALAAAEKLPVTDIHKLMTGVNANARAADPAFTMIPDSIHPDPAGHLVMAFGLLQAFGVPPFQATLDLDLAAGTAAGSDGVKVSGLQRTEHGHEFRLTLPHLPFFVEPAARKILPFLPFQETFNSLTLTCRGATSAQYSFKSGGTRTDAVTRAALEAGLPVQALWSFGPVAAAGRILDFTREKVQIYYRLWRTVALQGSSGGDFLVPAHDAARETTPVLEKARAAIVKAGIGPFTVKLVKMDVPGELLDDGDFIRSWSARGPFPSTPATDGRDFLGGEAALTAAVPTLPADWSAQDLDTIAPSKALINIFGQIENCCAYLLTILESPAAQDADLLIGSDDGFALWLNGAAVTDQLALRRGLAVDADRVPVRLRQGTNVLLLKVSQGGGDWGVCVRFAGLKKSVIARRGAKAGCVP